VNEKLAQHRRRRGWSQARIAHELRRLAAANGEPAAAVTANEVSRWERGVRNPRPRYVGLLCQLFELSARDLGLADVDELPVAPPPPAMGTMVGRERELRCLGEELVQAGSGAGRMVLVTGEAGMGKSRLCRHLALAAAGQGYHVLWGSCEGNGLSRPYAPFVEAIGDHLERVNLAGLRRALGPMCQELPRLFPQLRAGPAAAGVEDPDSQVRLHEEVSALLGAIADRHGVVLVLDDIHWADASTRRLLNHVSRQVRSQRTLLVCTLRAEEQALQPGLAVQVRAWSRVAHVIEMQPLDAGQVGELARELAREGAGELDLPDPLCDLLHSRSGGNPYAVRELLEVVRQQGDLAPAQLRLPETLREATLGRVRRMSDSHVEVLRAAAVLGETIDEPTLSCLVGGDDERTRWALRAWADALLLKEDAREPGRMRFRHALTRQAVYEDLPPGLARELHRRAAGVLEARNGPSVAVARHLIAAGSSRRAVIWCVRAAREAAEERAHGTAAELYEHALTLADEPVQRARIQCELGTARLLAGEDEDAEQPLIEGVDALQLLGLPVEAAKHRLTLARVRCGRTRTDEAHGDYGAARKTLDGLVPTAELANSYLRLASCLNDAGRPVAAVAEHAIEIGRQLGQRSIVLRAQTILAPEHLYRGRVREGLEMLDATVDEALGLRLDRIAEQATFYAVIHHAHLNPTAAARRLSLLRARSGVGWTSAMQSAAEAHHEAIVGNYAAALAHLERARDTFRSLRIASWSRWVDAHLAVVHARLGRIDDARRWRPHPSEPLVHSAITSALVGLDLDEPDRGADVVELARRLHVVPVMLHSMVGDLAVAVLAARRDVDGARAVAAAMPGSHPEVPDGQFRLMIEARVAHAEGDMPRAAELLRAGADAMAAVGCEEYGRDVRLLLSDTLDRLGDRPAAALELRRVIEGAWRRGSLLQLRRAGERIRERQDLTLRERDVARLIARGMTDPAIARELGISTRTAESHGATIRRKLGGGSRAEIAAWVAARTAAGKVPPPAVQPLKSTT
jgi:DNA-binding CsgD family transcriptional regulator/transcriptional regulator with XRE-family HTH domain/tetratricopeptide (TPR) repeat protein